MQFKIVNCFCSDAEGSGNKAAVIVNHIADKAAKQNIANQIGLPVTVFITDDKNFSFPQLEYFYPATEMPLCLHGTIAAFQVLFDKKKQPVSKFITVVDKRILEVINTNSIIQVKVSKQNVAPVRVDIDFICSLLNLKQDNAINRQLPFAVSSVGSPKLLIPLKSEEILFNLKPDFPLITAWSIKNPVNGLYAYTPAKTHKETSCFIARGFNPKTGHHEDAATGVAAAALALLLKKSILVQQGKNMGNVCHIMTSYVSDDCIFVGGKVSAPFTSTYEN